MTDMISGIFLLLGGNLGDPERSFEQVKLQLKQNLIEIIDESALYQAEAWGLKNQSPFLNQVLKVSASKNPLNLLKLILSIEEHLGRKREIKWGPRSIDIDLLYFNQEIIKSNDLIIPHPEIQNRRFVLVPMNELAPDFIHPVYKKSQRWLLAHCKDDLKVEKRT